MRKILSVLALLAACLGVAASVHAETWPSRPIRLIVPYAAGQGTDIAGRYLADELGKELKQAFVVDNRAGAAGNVGAAAAARAAPDGYTIVLGTNATHAANSFLYANPGFDPQVDFEPLGMIGILPLVYVTRPDNPINSMQEVVRAAKAKPNTLNVAISTTTCRMAHELLKAHADAPMFPIDFKGSGQALAAVIGGQVEYMVDTITSLRGAIEGKQVKPLGVTSAHATKLLPGVPSLAEQGIAGYELTGWIVFYAPKGTPPDVVRALSAAIDKTVARADVQQKLLQIGIEPQVKSREELKAFGIAEKEKWGRLVKAAGLLAKS